MRANILRGLVLVQVLGTALVGCGAGGGGGDAETGSASEVNLALSALPAGVQCIQVSVTSGATVLATQNFPASSSWTATIGLGATFTKGSVSVAANAYSVACSSIAGVTPKWVSDVATTDITPGRANPVTLNFRENLGVSATANFAPTVVDIALGPSSTGLVFADGTVKIGGWLAQPTGLTSVVELALGDTHGCARKTDGTVWCWGTNHFGELGNGTTTGPATSPVPVQVTGLAGATSLAAGSDTSCATVAPSNEVMCWGSNPANAFMDGQGLDRHVAATVNHRSATRMSLKSQNLCFIDAGSLMVTCGGLNDFGQLGLGSTVPAPFGGSAGAMSAQSIAVGNYHACAADPSGRVRCWGDNVSGQLGLNSQTNSSLPIVLTTPTGVEELAATGSGTCARTVAGVVYCWGSNFFGSIGDGTNAQRLSPVQVLTGSKKLRAGADHVCSLQVDASIKCWGANGSGQLLDGTHNTSDIPVLAKL